MPNAGMGSAPAIEQLKNTAPGMAETPVLGSYTVKIIKQDILSPSRVHSEGTLRKEEFWRESYIMHIFFKPWIKGNARLTGVVVGLMWPNSTAGTHELYW